jgi:hypothetical protein
MNMNYRTIWLLLLNKVAPNQMQGEQLPMISIDFSQSLAEGALVRWLSQHMGLTGENLISQGASAEDALEAFISTASAPLQIGTLSAREQEELVAELASERAAHASSKEVIADLTQALAKLEVAADTTLTSLQAINKTNQKANARTSRYVVASLRLLADQLEGK